ncbi:MAG: D-serine ammonia-lyase [Planctomycetota bacterium]
MPSQEALAKLSVTYADIESARDRCARFAHLLAELFPETANHGGIIESPIVRTPQLQRALLGIADDQDRVYSKCDHALPVAGSIKARGGIHEVLECAERIALTAGIITTASDYRQLLQPAARQLFSRHTVAVGSTGNLGLSIGVMAAALGFKAQVHMSADAKQWKKDRLRSRGVEVVEHRGDYEQAVAAGRAAAVADPRMYFVDDERSLSLFLGYSVAALRLRDQLRAQSIPVDATHPLCVYLPCGVGGAPAGITFGLKHMFGDHVHCFFAEPTASPCFLTRMIHRDRPNISVYDIGLDNRTEADGLAVPKASELAVELMRPLLSGIFTVADETLFRDLCLAKDCEGMQIEPSAAAGFSGPAWLRQSATGRAYLTHHGLTSLGLNHILWTTGGLFVPDQEYQRFYARGQAALGRAVSR